MGNVIAGGQSDTRLIGMQRARCGANPLVTGVSSAHPTPTWPNRSRTGRVGVYPEKVVSIWYRSGGGNDFAAQ